MKSRVVVNPNDERDVSQGTTIRFWASERYQNKGNAVHRSLKKKGCKKEDAAAITKLGLDCTGPNSGARPTVEQVLETLSGLDDGRHTNPYNLPNIGFRQQ
ncbi:hypothetical protein F0562_028862 [Nyssa sinensis]|uniref:Uncharacterized protein n=1 Tax=Nyssa sinensis TaxID=561372 RepID=A0A5J5B187_9ASTE|nr:hypothetical protein F0562_028862 [Nyssa sinensis]